MQAAAVDLGGTVVILPAQHEVGLVVAKTAEYKAEAQ
jgi:hypothetical protein